MQLADFIVENTNAIIANWEVFAATQTPAATRMTRSDLRDHAQQILDAMVKDLSTPQTKKAQAEKSAGRPPPPADAPETAAQTHAVLRARSDFDINQLAAEYRALRASVLRLWMVENEPKKADLDDIIRFNEAIDQALAESIDYFSAQVEQTRNLSLGMIGHDLRNPLQTIQLTAQYFATLNAGEDVSRASARLIHSSARMQALLDDLVVFNRIKLGMGFPITPRDVNLAELFEHELDQLRAAHPDRQLELTVTGDTRGHWDPQRLYQLLGNLVTNALKYGAPDAPVRVLISDKEAHVCFEVINVGAAIEPSVLRRIFEPLTTASDNERGRAADHSLGLGLFIAREIAVGHGGEIGVQSDGRETVFSVRLPRHPVSTSSSQMPGNFATHRRRPDPRRGC